MTALVRAARQAVLTAYRGRRVECSWEDYPAIRSWLVRSVRFLFEEGDEERAERVMTEILRLDGIHGGQELPGRIDGEEAERA